MSTLEMFLEQQKAARAMTLNMCPFANECPLVKIRQDAGMKDTNNKVDCERDTDSKMANCEHNPINDLRKPVVIYPKQIS